MQDHASAIFQRDELTHRKALISTSVGALWLETADGAKTYDATWLDRRETTRADISRARVRVPATLHTAHFRTPEHV
ncbi:MAG: hypothetical protein C0498_07070 [Anaerolinea sp.]|nr:hypothetical protein [Anaerolinea sp.]